MKPPQPHQQSRINLVELKSQIVRKLGPERSKQYFHYLSRLLGMKIGKVEFDKLCVRILGRENLALHNHFIRSILKNACSAKVPPSSHDDNELLVHATAGSNKETSGDAVERNGPLGTKGKSISTSLRPSITRPCDSKVIEENRDYSAPCVGDLGLDPTKVSVLTIPTSAPVSVHNKDRVRNEGEESRAKVQPQAPLGIPLCNVRTLPLMSDSKRVCTSGALLDTLTLRERMEQIAIKHDLEGVPIDCANLLNKGLDSYLKSIIIHTVQLMEARSRCELTKPIKKHPINGKLVNGMELRTCRPLEVIKENTPPSVISLQDFRVAMELNPQQLGEDWPLLLERICTESFDE
ncbi:unnamed protein product [Cuscuta europaea]|uniref:Transcriptional coactivator Hfi1/Transcriptional adapter 1 n=2 Tax=Cuscuta europaea TaxID=41803 RepID=A0A9P1EHF0_CUSEU|nr:unnamed protein product [Cuscuta europaea]